MKFKTLVLWINDLSRKLVTRVEFKWNSWVLCWYYFTREILQVVNLNLKIDDIKFVLCAWLKLKDPRLLKEVI